MNIISFLIKAFNTSVHVKSENEDNSNLAVDSKLGIVNKPVKSYASKLTSSQINEMFKKAFDQIQATKSERSKHLDDFFKRFQYSSLIKEREDKIKREADAKRIKRLCDEAFTEIKK